MSTDKNITQEQFESIERYFNDTMPDEKRAQFEHKLNTDPEFKQLVEDVKQVLLGIESASLQNKLDDFHDEMIPVRSLHTPETDSSPVSKSARYKFFRFVAAASVVIAFGAFWFLSQDSPSERLFAKHFTPDPGLPITMGATENFEFYDAMVNYKQGEYKTAIEKWQALLPVNQENDTLHYFLGVAHLANGDETKAIDYLKELTETEPNSFKEETVYYLGLAYLKADNMEDAKKYLTFSQTESANQILSELND